MATETSDASLDSVHVETLIKAVAKAGEKSATNVRIFERNDFYYLFDKDGEMAAKFTYGSVTALKTMGKKTPVSFCVMNHANFESLLKHILLVKHFRIEIFKFVAPKGGNAASYHLEVRASPGNISSIEHILYGEGEMGTRDTNFLVGIKLNPSLVGGQVSLGLAAVDTSLNMVKVSDFLDNEHFTNLEAILVQLGPREVILPQTENASVKKICEMVERNRILVTQKSTKDFSPLTETEIKRMFNAKSNTDLLKSEGLSSGALNSVFNYLNFDTSSSKFCLELLSSATFMRLTSRAMAGLNVFPSPTNPSPHSSLYAILNQTRSPGGGRLLQQWLKQPLLDPVMINERLDLVEIMVNSTEMRQMLFEDHLRKFPDFQRLSAKFGSSKASLQDMYKVYVSLSKLDPLVNCLQEYAGEGNNYATLQDNFIKDFQEAQKDFEKFYQMVETTLDLKQVDQGQFLIKPDFDDNLGELREQLDNVEQKVRDQEGKASAELGVERGKVLKLEHSGQHGYYFRLTMKEEKIVRGNKNFTIMEANKSGIKFRNSRLEQLNDSHADLSKKYEEQQRSIVNEMVAISSGYTEPMSHLGQVISKLDVLVSLAVAAVSAPTQFCRPKVLANTPSQAAQLHLTQLRHPIVELQDSVNYIPNDVQFSPDSTLHLITGPNMGGKSTYLRSVGMAVLMAQCGSFVPAETAEMTVMDSILVRIGASDCQVDGISTFMAEMVETHSILSTATASSLVLIDELGRGTSTYDGFGLAWAVSDHIARVIKCPTLFTTHYTELTELADQVETVTNFHVSALISEEKLTLLYQLQPGVCDQSFGIDVAKIANFPEEVIENAKKRIAKLEGINLIQKENFTGEQRQKIVIEGGEIIGDYLEKIKQLESIGDDNEIVEKFQAIKKEILASNNDYLKSLIAQSA
eukprot:TRINITY_DN10022_c0_g1_i1.p1 TRINITY_DN10022_c0_g1~~TRINITY_DN10022_c0_g1_i1.p1  ORF type:complete len:917 (-),score=322.44 TRINITY_DN10022_c0_g1_i1:110-2860(-)